MLHEARGLPGHRGFEVSHWYMYICLGLHCRRLFSGYV